MSDRAQRKITLPLPAAGPAVSRAHVHAWTIEVLAGPDRGRALTALSPLVRIGTDPGCDLALTDRTVSQHHAELERTRLGLLVRDLQSRNGVLLEGRRILSAIVESGDRLSLGRTRLRIWRARKSTSMEVLEDSRFGDLWGESQAMRAVFAELRQLAREDVSLLIEGETGTGKELAARAVHAHSSRRDGPFQVLDCATAGETPGEAATVIREAAGGTLLLDEIGELKPDAQQRLLRLLDTEGDVRVIASSQRNLDEEVRRERFRADLYFRIAAARVRLPPLRARRDDIPGLVRGFLAERGRPFDVPEPILALLQRHDWPGNARELRNVLERGIIWGPEAAERWLDPGGERAPAPPVLVSALATLSYHQAKDRVVSDFERIYFREVMKASDFDAKVAQEKTGLSLQSLYRLLKKNGIRLRDLR